MTIDLRTVTEPTYTGPAAFDFRAVERQLAALPELDRERVEGMIAELRTVHGIGRHTALEIVVKAFALLWRRNNAS